jgi:thymidylate synthase (FAD)
VRILDHGEVSLIDQMAGDHKVYGSARVSTGKRPEDSSKGEAADTGLIRFLMQNGHGTPFEHAVFQLFVKAPIFVVREWQRHRMASYNEQSGRYSEFHPEFYVPDHVRTPDP